MNQDSPSRPFIETLPRVVREFAESKSVLYMVWAFLALILFIVARDGHLWYIVTSTIAGSLLPVLWFRFRPFNPFNNMYSDWEGISREGSANDPQVQMFLELLSSSMAERYLLRVGLTLGIGQCIVALLVSSLIGSFVSVGNPADDLTLLLEYIFLLGMFAYGIEMMLLLRWAFRQLDHGRCPG